MASGYPPADAQPGTYRQALLDAEPSDDRSVRGAGPKDCAPTEVARATPYAGIPAVLSPPVLQESDMRDPTYGALFTMVLIGAPLLFAAVESWRTRHWASLRDHGPAVRHDADAAYAGRR